MPPLPLRVLQRLQTGQTVKLAGFGDSITGVYYHTGARRAWPEILGEKLRSLYPQTTIEIVNAGISGNTTAQGLARLETDVLAHAPHLVVVMFGMNDVARATLEDYANNLRQIVQRITAQGSEVILMTPNYAYNEDPVRPLDRIAEFSAVMRQVAQEFGLLLADAFAAYQAVHERGLEVWMRLMSDPVHPNYRGHTLFADTVIATLCQCDSSAVIPRALHDPLPCCREKLATAQPIRIVAMTPCDTLIAAAMHQLSPATPLEIIPWETAGKDISQLEQDVLQIGWTRYRDNPALPQPDLFVVTAPPRLNGIGRVQFYRSFAMILNRAQRFDTAQWDCLPILPSVMNTRFASSAHEVEALMRMSTQDKDLVAIHRAADETTSPADLLRGKLRALLNA